MTSNINILYTVGKSFFDLTNNSRSLPQNKASFGLEQLSKFSSFCMEMRVVDPVTFFANGGYHYNEEAERNWPTPNWASKVAINLCSSSTTIAAITRLHHCKQWCFTKNGARPSFFSVLWSQNFGACSLIATGFSDRKWAATKERERKNSHGRGGEEGGRDREEGKEAVWDSDRR